MKNLLVFVDYWLLRVSVIGIGVASAYSLLQGNIGAAFAGSLLLGLVGVCWVIGRNKLLDF